MEDYTIIAQNAPVSLGGFKVQFKKQTETEFRYGIVVVHSPGLLEYLKKPYPITVKAKEEVVLGETFLQTHSPLANVEFIQAFIDKGNKDYKEMVFEHFSFCMVNGLFSKEDEEIVRQLKFDRPQKEVTTKEFVSGCCEGEVCSVCSKPATNKLEETIFPDDPNRVRHPLTAYVCREHFKMIVK